MHWFRNICTIQSSTCSFDAGIRYMKYIGNISLLYILNVMEAVFLVLDILQFLPWQFCTLINDMQYYINTSLHFSCYRIDITISTKEYFVNIWMLLMCIFFVFAKFFYCCYSLLFCWCRLQIMKLPMRIYFSFF